jgi:hypothetical protein
VCRFSTAGQAPLFTIPPPTPANSRGPGWPLWVVYAVGVVGGAVVLHVAAGQVRSGESIGVRPD